MAPRAKKKKQLERPKHHPLYVIRKARDLGIREVVVAVSGGRDSVVALDLCHQHFDRVAAYFMYFVEGLSFQEKYLRYLEHRYHLEILRLPHWALSHMYRDAVFRHATKQSLNTKLVKIRDVDAYVRRRFGIDWVATGEKCRDSMERNTVIVQADGVHMSRHRVWPIAWWTHYDVQSYMTLHGILPAPEYKVMLDGKSFGSLWNAQIAGIAKAFPEDYEKIRRVFPLIDGQIQRHIQMEKRKGKPDGSEVS